MVQQAVKFQFWFRQILSSNSTRKTCAVWCWSCSWSCKYYLASNFPIMAMSFEFCNVVLLLIASDFSILVLSFKSCNFVMLLISSNFSILVMSSSCDLCNLQCCFVVDCKQLFSILVGSFRNNTACPLPSVILNRFKGFQSCKLATSKMFVADLVAYVVATLCHSILVLHAAAFVSKLYATTAAKNCRHTLVIDSCAFFASVCLSTFLWISRNHFCLSSISM